MDQKAVKLMKELRELQVKALDLAAEQKRTGEKIQAAIESHRRWLERSETQNG